MAQKKAKAPEPAGESAPMWIVSFADLVTLLMSFFVVLYALKQGGEKQQIEVAAAIRAEFDSTIPPPDTPDPFLQAVRRAHGLPGPPLVNTHGKEKDPTKGADGSNKSVETIVPDKSIVTGGKINFDQNSAVLDAGSIDTIHQIYDQIRGYNNVVIIKGHVSADEIPLRPDDPNGMNLSYQRAKLVADELAKLGVERRILRPMPCGPFEPLKTGVYDQASLRQNRRVDVFMTNYTVSDYSPEATVPATTSTGSEKDKSQK